MRYRGLLSSKRHVLLAGFAALALAGSLMIAAAPAHAQPKKGSDGKAAADTKAGPRPQVTMPDAEGIVLLIRTTLLTLNDAVQTGNFTVLRDRAAPGFRDANSAARLGIIFANLAQRGVDLAAVSILAPQLDETPVIDPRSSMLRIKGHFPGQPIRIDFDLLFQPVGGRWRVFGLAVQPVAAAPASTAAAPPRASKTQGNGAAGKAKDAGK